MQANNTTRFLRNVMVGLVASSAGAFIALPGSAMPEAKPTSAVDAPVEAVEEIPAPVAEETLPTPGTDVVTEADALVEEAPVADEVAADEEPIAEEVAADEAPVAEDAAMETEPVADEAMMDEEPVAEGEDIDADTVEAAEIETLSDDAVEAADTMDGEPVVEEPTVDEAPVADEAMMDEEPIADEAMDEAPVADDVETDEAPVAEGEEIDTSEFTISELTDSSDSFEILAAALAAADLTEILGGEGPFTVFAPTDEAFAALPEGAVDQLLLPENKDVLVQVLTYHVVPGAIMSTDLEAGDVATVEGSELTVALGETVTVNNANVVLPDVEASNGIIHIIDRVIIPPTPEADASETETAAAE